MINMKDHYSIDTYFKNILQDINDCHELLNESSDIICNSNNMTLNDEEYYEVISNLACATNDFVEYCFEKSTFDEERIHSTFEILKSLKTKQENEAMEFKRIAHKLEIEDKINKNKICNQIEQ